MAGEKVEYKIKGLPANQMVTTNSLALAHYSKISRLLPWTLLIIVLPIVVQSKSVPAMFCGKIDRDNFIRWTDYRQWVEASRTKATREHLY
jgi:hypothetical protein